MTRAAISGQSASRTSPAGGLDASAVAPAARTRLLVIGDSAAAGVARLDANEVVERVSPSFVDLLRAWFPTWAIVVDAIPHRRTAEVATTIDRILMSAKPDIVLLATGSNDLDLDWRRFVASDGRTVRNRTPLGAFTDSMRVVAAAVAAAGASLVLTDVLGMSLALRRPHLERLLGRDLGAMIERGGGQPRADAVTAQYRLAVARVSGEIGAPVAAYGEALDGHAPGAVIGVDGTHTSVAGHRVMAEVIAPILQQVIQERTIGRSRNGEAL
jgi:lysophospholipase L1-like esterase